MLLPFYFPTPVPLDRMLSGSESDVEEKSLPLSLSRFLPNISGAIDQLVTRPPRFEVSRSYAIINTHTHTLCLLWTNDQLVAGYTTHNRRVSIPSAGFELTIPSTELQQTCALDSTAAGIILRYTRLHKILHQGRRRLGYPYVWRQVITHLLSPLPQVATDPPASWPTWYQATLAHPIRMFYAF
jgi:hypothetical protein